MTNTYTPEQKRFLAAFLLEQFPWLANDNEQISGADQIETLCLLYGELRGR